MNKKKKEPHYVVVSETVVYNLTHARRRDLECAGTKLKKKKQ